jgi:sec-independent protein translocase protein TatB
VFDIGLGEIMLLAVVGLLVFGPEKLPKAAADAGRLIRQLRDMATGARRDLAQSAGLDLSEAQSALQDIADLHPKRLVRGLLDDPDDAVPGAKPARSGRANGTPGPNGTSGPNGATGPGGTAPATGAVPGAPAGFDPDAT